MMLLVGCSMGRCFSSIDDPSWKVEGARQLVPTSSRYLGRSVAVTFSKRIKTSSSKFGACHGIPQPGHIILCLVYHVKT